MKPVILAALAFMVFGGTVAQASGHTTTVKTWTMAGVQYTRGSSNATVVPLAIVVPGFSTEADCEAAVAAQNTGVATATTTSGALTIPATMAVFDGVCHSVKQFVFLGETAAP